jgi:cell division protein FtsB
MRTENEVLNDIEDVEVSISEAEDELQYLRDRLNKLDDELADLEFDEALEDE